MAEHEPASDDPVIHCAVFTDKICEATCDAYVASCALELEKLVAPWAFEENPGRRDGWDIYASNCEILLKRPQG